MPSKSAGDSLRNLAFFSGLPDTLLWHLGRAATRKKLKVDELLFNEGAPREMLAVVLSGEFSIERKQGDEPVQITVLGAGEVIGEAILLDEPNHGTSARATQPTEILLFKKEPLMKLLKDQPALYAALLGKVAKIINARIRRANAALLAGRTGAWPTPTA